MAVLNLASLLEHSARLTPDRVAVTCADRHLTYAQLDAAARQVAAGLAALGIRPGDHVALSCPNLPVFPIAYYGILKAGAVVVPMHVLLKPREIAYHLRDSEAKALLVFEGTPELPMAEMARAAVAETASCRHLIVLTLNPAAPSQIAGAMTLGQLVAGGDASFETRPRSPHDTAVLLYTSGTTGQPKGAELTHGNMTSNAISSYDMFIPAAESLLDQQVILITLPLFHSTAQTAQMNAGLYGGFRLVLLPRFEPASVLDTMQRERVGYWVAVPTMYWTLLQHARTHAVDTDAIAAHLRLGVSGGAPMPVEVLRDFESTFKVRILEGYGLSEAAPVVTFNQLQRPSKPGTVGLPIHGVDVRLIDDDGRPPARGARGELLVRGPNVMKGYYNRPDETAAAVKDGWLRTGDIATIDDEGYVTIVDRKKDMIIRGGINVYPREIEDVMMTHPAVSLVAVVGVPDERLGEEVKAFVVRRPGAEIGDAELIAWCREQLAAYKYPRQIEFRDTLPIGPTGKVHKRSLRGTLLA
jgi:long-chain acyl-CoA synthetase